MLFRRFEDQVSDRHLDMEPVLGIDTSSRSQFARKPFDGIHRIPFPFLEVGSRHVGTVALHQCIGSKILLSTRTGSTNW